MHGLSQVQTVPKQYICLPSVCKLFICLEFIKKKIMLENISCISTSVLLLWGRRTVLHATYAEMCWTLLLFHFTQCLQRRSLWTQTCGNLQDVVAFQLNKGRDYFPQKTTCVCSGNKLLFSTRGVLGCIRIVEICCLALLRKKIEHWREVQIHAGSMSAEIQILRKTIQYLLPNSTQSGEELFAIITLV